MGSTQLCRRLRIYYNIRPHTYMSTGCISNESLETSSPPWLRILMVNSDLGQLSWPYCIHMSHSYRPQTQLFSTMSSVQSVITLRHDMRTRWNVNLRRFHASQVTSMRTRLKTCCHSWQWPYVRPKRQLVTSVYLCILQFNVICRQDGNTICSYCVFTIIHTSLLSFVAWSSTFTWLCAARFYT